MSRIDGREPHQPRELRLTTDYIIHPEGSVLVETGDTKVICTATVEESVPAFLKGKGKGWVSAEYSMLPRATNTRVKRERGKIGGRTQEIQRLIGRSLRSVVDMEALGERCIWIDCDVIQADGGTRTASITGGFVALVLAIRKLESQGAVFSRFPVTKQVAGISLGLVDDEILLDLNYPEDSSAQVDMNVIMTNDMKIIEIQGTAEQTPFSRETLNQMLDITEKGLAVHFKKQLEVLKGSLNSTGDL